MSTVVAWVDEAGGEHAQCGLGADGVDHFGVPVDVADAENVGHVGSLRLA